MLDRLVEFVYPELLEVPPEDRSKLLTQARDGEYDTIEWLGLAFAITATVLLTRYSVADLSWANRVTAVLTNFLSRSHSCLLWLDPLRFGALSDI
jgi:hypothetical protein